MRDCRGGAADNIPSQFLGFLCTGPTIHPCVVVHRILYITVVDPEEQSWRLPRFLHELVERAHPQCAQHSIRQKSWCQAKGSQSWTYRRSATGFCRLCTLLRQPAFGTSPIWTPRLPSFSREPVFPSKVLATKELSRVLAREDPSHRNTEHFFTTRELQCGTHTTC